MELIRYVTERNWPVVFGYVFFTGMMATGYYYNANFVQLGLLDLVTRMGTRTYAPGKASVAVVGDEQQVVTPADPMTR